ncbi:unnamed protein product [Sphagnum troendelagicum]|uniref:RRM domain-containing protein n=1 Tax=Sphagnum troendelagicum TaxID=128251 RepID=A0ABP0TUN6_9BRYO
MANLMSELERFEQEMKELGSEPSSSMLLPSAHLVAPVQLPLPPPPPPPPYGIATASNSVSTPTAGSVINGSLLGPSLQPSPLQAPKLPPPPPPPPPSPPVAVHLLPPRPSPSAISPSSGPLPPPPQLGSHMPWLNNSTSVSPSSPALTSGPVTQYSYAAAPTSSYTPAPPPPPQISSGPTSPQPQPQQSNAAVSTSQYPYPTVYQQSATTEVHALPQQQQAQQLFQRDAQTITPEALESVKAALASGDGEHKAEAKKKAVPRKAAGQSWEDPTLADWPENDHRLFCGDLGNEVNDEVLTKAFARFSSFNMARVVRDKRTGKTKGYGFVSFANPSDLALALKEMNGKYVGNRPIKMRKSTWKDRTDAEALDKHKVLFHKRQKNSKKHILHK